MGASENTTSYTYNYRLTVTVIDHGETKKATGVVRVRERVSKLERTKRWLDPQLCGEALPIQLRSGKVLFALLNGPLLDVTPGRQQWRSAPTQVLLQGLHLPTEWPYQDDSGIRHLPDTRQPVTLGPNERPEFVTFRDLKDPNSIVQVNPEHPENFLGRDVRVESVTVEATDAEVTKGSVRTFLPWFDPVRNYLDGTTPYYSGNKYHSYQFVRCQ